MALTFKYAVLMAIPDPGRGERVNVGLVIFLKERIDVRFSELSKIRALTGHDWTGYAKELERQLVERFPTGMAAQEVLEGSPNIDPVFRLSDLAWFSINSTEEYEARVGEILRALVVRPRPEEARETSTRINTEIAKQLRKATVLADKDESIDSHKVVRDYFVEDELRADFAQKNGVLRVAATLDLRRPHLDIREATLKSVVLDRARKVHPGVMGIGVYAAPSRNDDHVKAHLKLLGCYADKLFDWEDRNQRKAFMNVIFDGLAMRGPLA